MGIGKFPPPPSHKIDIPEPIDKKFGTVDYVSDGNPYNKCGTNLSTGGFWANQVKCNKKLFIYLNFFPRLTCRSDLLMDFYA